MHRKWGVTMLACWPLSWHPNEVWDSSQKGVSRWHVECTGGKKQQHCFALPLFCPETAPTGMEVAWKRMRGVPGSFPCIEERPLAIEKIQQTSVFAAWMLPHSGRGRLQRHSAINIPGPNGLCITYQVVFVGFLKGLRRLFIDTTESEDSPDSKYF